MKNRLIIPAALLAALLLLSSCYTLTLDVDNQKPVSVTGLNVIESYRVVGHFNETVRASFTLGGLISLNEEEVNEIIDRKLARYDGDGVVNLTYTTEMGPMDFLINLGVGMGGYMLGSAVGGEDPQEAVSAGASFSSLATFLYSTRTVNISGEVIRTQ